MFSSCLGCCRGRRNRGDEDDDEAQREPLLPRYEQDTHLQRALYRKLHSYQMLRALGKGYMPSTEQAVVSLRTLLASDVLNPDTAPANTSDSGTNYINPDLSDDGRRLARLARLWIQQLITLLLHKNGADQLQDLLWYLARSRVSVDAGDLAARARRVRGRADAAAAYQSLRAIGELLLASADVRRLGADLGVVGREIASDSARALGDAAKKAGDQLEPSSEDQQAVAAGGAAAGTEVEADGPQKTNDGKKPAPTPQDLESEFEDVGRVVAERGADVAAAAAESAHDKFSGDEGRALIRRVQDAVASLRRRKDYTDSVSTLARLLQRYALVYARAAGEVAEAAQADVHENREADRALRNLGAFVRGFGKPEDWDACARLLRRVVAHKDRDPDFEALLRELGDGLQRLLTDPEFFVDADAKLRALREKSRRVAGSAAESSSSLRHDIDELLRQLSVTYQSVLRDEDVHNILTTTRRLFEVLSPGAGATTINDDLVQDALHVFVPLLVSAVQYIPIPRLEVSTPSLDLLLESLVIEPGRTVNGSSFLPFRLRVENLNEVEIRKAHTRATRASMRNLILIKLDGLSARADEVGFWLRARGDPLLRLLAGCAAGEGLASFALDERGVDVHLEVEVCRGGLERVLALRAVRVRVHHLDYELRSSGRCAAWFFGWLAKPLLRPLLKAALEARLAQAVADFAHAANRELVFARERLRATRVADPGDLWTFVRAVAARFVPEPDPDLYARVGVDHPSREEQGAGGDVFRGVYTPASVVRIWHEEARRAEDRVEEFEAGGWRNEVFDTPVRGG